MPKNEFISFEKTNLGFVAVNVFVWPFDSQSETLGDTKSFNRNLKCHY